ncbi:hypothetical protein [Falsiroseomonas oryzae]|uniref:hypothetical protein n=1 Tax=Falsiroseomonas oryzae TaxID=2766473 RepID=UPI0022EA38DE|nr:hypothetical protein [Roseomonas sp. MO-31]
MRVLLLILAGLSATPAEAGDDAGMAMIVPQGGCEAPALGPAGTFREVQNAEAPPPFRRALLACEPLGQGPAKRPLRRT